MFVPPGMNTLHSTAATNDPGNESTKSPSANTDKPSTHQPWVGLKPLNKNKLTDQSSFTDDADTFHSVDLSASFNQSTQNQSAVFQDVDPVSTHQPWEKKKPHKEFKAPDEKLPSNQHKFLNKQLFIEGTERTVVTKNSDGTEGLTITGDIADCKHLSAFVASYPARKTPVRELFSMEDGVKPKVKCTTEDYKKLSSGDHVGILRSDELGKWLVHQCVQLKDQLDMLKKSGQPTGDEQPRTWMKAIIGTGVHAMTIQVEVKESPTQGYRYVASLYDPNITNDFTRSATENLGTLEKYSLGYFVNPNHTSTSGKGWMETYSEATPNIIDIAPATFWDGRPANEAVPFEGARPDFSTPEGVKQAGYRIWHSLAHDTSPEILTAIQDIEKYPANKVKEIIAAKSETGMPGLYMALQNNSARAVSAYADLVAASGVKDPAFLLELLTAEFHEDEYGLNAAMDSNCGEAIAAYADFFEKLDIKNSPMILKILMTAETGNKPLLQDSFNSRKFDAISGFCSLLDKVSDRLNDKAKEQILNSLNSALQHPNVQESYKEFAKTRKDEHSRFEQMRAKLKGGSQ